MPCHFEIEQDLLRRGIRPIAGIDEAGRGPLAGPVVAAALIIEGEFPMPEGLNDSKKLTAKKREALFEILTTRQEFPWAIGVASVEEIDRINILRATHLAMRRAVENLPTRPAHGLVDGLPVRDLPVPHTAVVGGDGISLSIAAASILAKVTRDRMMLDLDRQFPAYGFARHKGYATREHLLNLQTHGPCPAHRKSFAPVAQCDLFARGFGQSRAMG